MKKIDKIKVGISVGDINGIGTEIILKTFVDSRMLELCTPILFASSKLISIHKKELNINTQIHSIENISTQRAMTLHIYASPIDECKVYNDEKDCFEMKEMSYHSFKELEEEICVS